MAVLIAKIKNRQKERVDKGACLSFSGLHIRSYSRIVIRSKAAHDRQPHQSTAGLLETFALIGP